MIRVEGISKRYNGFRALGDLSFQVQEGEVFGIVGPNGAGKTTALKVISGLLEPTAGWVEIDGLRMDKEPQKVKQVLGFLPEESPVYEDMTPLDYLMFFAEVFEIDRTAARERIHDLLESLDLKESSKPLGSLSKGMRRKVVIARSLINDPKVLIYDEPTSGLDISTSNFILKYIWGMKGKKTIIFSTHNLFQAERLCDRLLILKGGLKLAEGSVKDLTGKMEYTLRFSAPADWEAPPGVLNEEGTLYFSSCDMDEVNSLAEEVIKRKGKIVGIDTKGQTLEDVFLDITA